MGLISVLKSIFFSDGPSVTSFYQFYSQLKNWKQSAVYPYSYQLPERLSIDSDIWTRFIKLYKYTRSDEMERAVSLFWVDGELVLSGITKGNRKAVTPKNNVSVKYVPTSKREYFEKRVYVDNSIYSKRTVYYKKIPKKIELNYLFNIHTHPPHEAHDGSGRIYYNYFSAQDIKSMLASKVTVTAMIGDKLWLLFRTKDTPDSADNLTDAQMSPEYLRDKLGIITYCGEFKGYLERV